MALAMAASWARGSSIVQQRARFAFNVLLGVAATMLLQHLASQVSSQFLRETSPGLNDVRMAASAAQSGSMGSDRGFLDPGNPARADVRSPPADLSRANAILSELRAKLDALAMRLPALSADLADFEAIAREPDGLHLPPRPPVADLPLPDLAALPRVPRDEPSIYQHQREQNSARRQTPADSSVTADATAGDDPATAGTAAEDPKPLSADGGGELSGEGPKGSKGSGHRQLLSEDSGDEAPGNVSAEGGGEGGYPPRNTYFLAAVVYNRVFRGDRLNFSSFEIWQWVAFMRLGGVEHVFWYDCAHDASERQSEALGPFVRAGYLTYVPLHRELQAGYSVFPEQNGAILHYLQHHRDDATWALFCDVDEFVFTPRDLRPGFLFRFMHNVSLANPAVTQVLAPNLFFVGNSEAPRSSLVFRRFTKCQHLADWRQHLQRSKPIVRPAAVEQWEDMRVEPHYFPMAAGETERVDPTRLRMHHYWGPRGTGFGAETRAFEEGVERDSAIQPWEEPVWRLLSPGLPYLTYLEAKRRILEAADSAMRLSYTLADPFEWR